MFDLVFTGWETVGVVDDDLLLVVEVGPVQLLVSLELTNVSAGRFLIPFDSINLLL